MYRKRFAPVDVVDLVRAEGLVVTTLPLARALFLGDADPGQPFDAASGDIAWD